MPWLSIPFQQTAIRTELAEFYGIRGIPTLLLLDNNGHVITMDARTELAEDPSAQVLIYDFIYQFNHVSAYPSSVPWRARIFKPMGKICLINI